LHLLSPALVSLSALLKLCWHTDDSALSKICRDDTWTVLQAEMRGQLLSERFVPKWLMFSIMFYFYL